MKNPVMLVLVIYFALMLAFCAQTILRHYDTLTNGEDYKFTVSPYDPYDPFHGRYVELRTEPRIPRSYSSATSYALLVTDELGFVETVDVTVFKPQSGVYVKNLRLQRYYMNEKLAPEAQSLTGFRRKYDDMYLLVKVKNGNYAIEGLYVNGTRIEDYIASRN